MIRDVVQKTRHVTLAVKLTLAAGGDTGRTDGTLRKGSF